MKHNYREKSTQHISMELHEFFSNQHSLCSYYPIKQNMTSIAEALPAPVHFPVKEFLFKSWIFLIVAEDVLNCQMLTNYRRVTCVASSLITEAAWCEGQDAERSSMSVLGLLVSPASDCSLWAEYTVYVALFCERIRSGRRTLSVNHSSGQDEAQPLVTVYKCPAVVWTVNPSVMNTLYVVPGLDKGSQGALMAFAVNRFR